MPKHIFWMPLERKRWIFIIFAMMSVACVQAQTVKQLENQRKQTLKELENTNKLLKETKKSQKSSLNKLSIIGNNINQRQTLITNINSEIGQLDIEMGRLDAEKKGLEAELTQLKNDYVKLVREAHKNRSLYTKVLFVLSAKSFDQSMRRLRYLQEYTDYRKEQVVKIDKVRHQIIQKNDSLQQHKTTQVKIVKQKQIETVRLTGDQQKEKVVLTDLQKKEKNLRGDLKKQQKKAADLNARIERMIAEEIRKAEARRVAEAQKKALAEKRAKETARLKELAEKKIKEELAAKQREAEAAKARKDAAAKEQAAKKAREAAEKKERELAAARAKDAADKKARQEAAEKARELANARTDEAAKAKQLADTRTDEASKAKDAVKEIEKSQNSIKSSSDNDYVSTFTKEEIALTGSFENNRGRLPMPVSNGFISGHFGIQPHAVLKHVTTNNKGIYILSSAGTSARAVFDGVVTQRFYIQGSNGVIIQHGNYRTVYANLTDIYVSVGQKVSARQSIGKIFTDSDNDNKTELYFQIWEGKKLLNPETWISR